MQYSPDYNIKDFCLEEGGDFLRGLRRMAGGFAMAVLLLLFAVLTLPFALPRALFRSFSRYATRGPFAHYLTSLQAGALRIAARVSPRFARRIAVFGPILASVALWGLLFATYAGPMNYVVRAHLDTRPLSRPDLALTVQAPAVAGRLHQAAAAEESLFVRRKKDWSVSAAIAPEALASASFPVIVAGPLATHAPGQAFGQLSAPLPGPAFGLSAGSLSELAGAPATVTATLSRTAFPVLFGIRQGRPVGYSVAGVQDLSLISEGEMAGSQVPYDEGSMLGIASGKQGVEVLLDKLRQEQAAPDLAYASLAGPAASLSAPTFLPVEMQAVPAFESEFDPENPNAGIGLICRSDRMELAAWLEQLRVNARYLAPNYMAQAAKYSGYVERYSTRYALSPSLIYAIMRIESSFNPNAVSVANALGLMQVVPQTAGGEVHAYLHGKSGIPARETLFTPEQNIQYGTTYLHLLNNRHFKEVQNHLSRELCIIAAYNGGPGSVYRVFDRDREKAIAKINKLSPEELFSTLVRDLPAQETRDYVVKVVEARNRFLYSKNEF
ncbi:transglycosylase SLT domain-containing protein [Desulfovibrio sp. OttesenSCG-928-C14]|nr:transglycosylase SLT domain-containing protein [Desulfovibrio sp. OttesenSCG-928-C14]